MYYSDSLENENLWHYRFLAAAGFFAGWSKDPSTQTGGVIVRPEKKRIVGIGFNGFPRAIKDDPVLLNTREEKYKRVVHSELNAILNTESSTEGCVLYNWPGQSCSRCAVHVIQAGIKCVVSPVIDNGLAERWKEEMTLAQDLYHEAGLQVIYLLDTRIDKVAAIQELSKSLDIVG
jgi:dCMP deaminase